MTIQSDKNNYRKHDEKNKKLINKSLKDLGAGRSILIDSKDSIIAGNATFEQAKELGIPVKIIETDGKELIAVKRTDLKPEDKKRKELALIDNHATDTSVFDFDAIQKDFDSEFLSREWNFEVPDLDIDDIDKSNFFRPVTEAEQEKLNKKKISLEYPPEEGELVESSLADIASNPSLAVWKLLGL